MRAENTHGSIWDTKLHWGNKCGDQQGCGLPRKNIIIKQKNKKSEVCRCLPKAAAGKDGSGGVRGKNEGKRFFFGVKRASIV